MTPEGEVFLCHGSLSVKFRQHGALYNGRVAQGELLVYWEGQQRDKFAASLGPVHDRSWRLTLCRSLNVFLTLRLGVSLATEKYIRVSYLACVTPRGVRRRFN